jgi:hypothetical protein
VRVVRRRHRQNPARSAAEPPFPRDGSPTPRAIDGDGPSRLGDAEGRELTGDQIYTALAGLMADEDGASM